MTVRRAKKRAKVEWASLVSSSDPRPMPVLEAILESAKLPFRRRKRGDLLWLYVPAIHRNTAFRALMEAAARENARRAATERIQ